MPLVPMRPLLDAADKYNYANGAFNVNADSQAEAVIRIHDTLQSAAILQGSEGANGFLGDCADFRKATIEQKKVGAARIAGMVKKYTAETNVPVVLHLDHGKDFESVQAAIDNGYTSVMIDGSSLPYDENVALTREVVKYAHARGVSVEGELGILAGEEDHVFSETSTYTDPNKVVDFFRKTKCDCLAISYGTQHGATKGSNVKIRQQIAIAAYENLHHAGIKGALVSHGSSSVPQYLVEEINELGGALKNAAGIPVSQIQSVIPHGIRKINVDTDIRLAVTRNVRRYFVENPGRRDNADIGPLWELLAAKPDKFDPRAYMTPIMPALISGDSDSQAVKDILDCMLKGVMEVVGARVVQFGSFGLASRVECKSLEEMADWYKDND